MMQAAKRRVRVRPTCASAVDPAAALPAQRWRCWRRRRWRHWRRLRPCRAVARSRHADLFAPAVRRRQLPRRGGRHRPVDHHRPHRSAERWSVHADPRGRRRDPRRQGRLLRLRPPLHRAVKYAAGAPVHLQAHKRPSALLVISRPVLTNLLRGSDVFDGLLVISGSFRTDCL